MAKLLLVEDDTNLSEIYQARMEAEGYEVVSASDGEAALAIAAKEKPDLIISDVMMPKISGFEMLDILRNTEGLKATPVIMLTALGQSDDKSRADQLGADRYLVKSQVTLEDIVNAAHSILDGNAAPGSQPAPAPADPSVPAPDPVAVTPAPAGPLAATEPAVMPVTVAPAPAASPTSDPKPATASAPTSMPVAAPPADNATPTPSAQPDGDTHVPAQTTAQESASVQRQIEGFEHRPVAPVSVPSVPPAETAARPAEQPAPASPSEPAPEPTSEQPAPHPGALDEKIIDHAIGQLLNKSPAVQPQPADPVHGQVLPSSDPLAAADTDPAERAQKKTLSPISGPTANLEELLAREEAKDIANGQPAAAPMAPATSVEPQPQPQIALPTVQPQPTATAQAGDASTADAESAAAPAPDTKDKPPFDPNSIAL